MPIHGVFLEVLSRSPMSLDQVPGVLAPLFGVDVAAVRPLLEPTEALVRFELALLPGSFPSKLSVYAEAGRGPSSDAELALALASATSADVLASLPEEHEEAANPAAWMLYSPGQDPRIAYERLRDDEGVDLA